MKIDLEKLEKELQEATKQCETEVMKIINDPSWTPEQRKKIDEYLKNR